MEVRAGGAELRSMHLLRDAFPEAENGKRLTAENAKSAEVSVASAAVRRNRMQKLKKLGTEAESGILRTRRPLDVFFAPENVAVIGATEMQGSVGRTLLWNLISTPFGGAVFPVNPKRSSVLGIKAYPSIAAVPEHVDLAVVIVPAQACPGVIRQCGEAGVKAAIVISAGFKELGPQGAALE